MLSAVLTPCKLRLTMLLRVLSLSLIGDTVAVNVTLESRIAVVFNLPTAEKLGVNNAPKSASSCLILRPVVLIEPALLKLLSPCFILVASTLIVACELSVASASVTARAK